MAFFETVPFDAHDEQHAKFVFGTFGSCLSAFRPYADLEPWKLRAQLQRELRLPGTRTVLVVPRGDVAPGIDRREAFLGWSALRPATRTVVFQYVTHSARRQGIASTLLIDSGIDPLTGPIGVAFWTPMAARIHLEHPPYSLFHDTRDERKPRDPAQKRSFDQAGAHPGNRDRVRVR